MSLKSWFPSIIVSFLHRLLHLKPMPCIACGYAEGDGICSDCITTQREEGRYEELWE